jgi:hypothetical protein
MYKFALAACLFPFLLTGSLFAQSEDDCEATCSVACYFGRCPIGQSSDENYIDATPNSSITQFRQEFSISEYIPGNSNIVEILQGNVGKIIYIDAIMHSDATGGQIYDEGAGKNDPKCREVYT